MDPLQASHAVPGNDSAGIPSPQFALLNYFFPGYSVLISTLNASLGADLNRYLPFVVAAVAVALSWRYVCDTVMNQVEASFMSSFTVHTDDETYNILMWWMTRQPFCHRTRNFVVNTSVYSRSEYLYRAHDESGGEDEDETEGSTRDVAAADDDQDTALAKNRGKHVLHYTPSAGTHWFWYRGVPLRFSRRQTKDKISLRNPSEQEELCVSCLGRDPAVLKRLLADARLLYLKKDDRKTVIYRATSSVSTYGTDSYWQRCMSRPNRDFSTVILPDKVKADIIADAGDYLDPATRRWYANRGIPYRRGYLLYGPPGTGKSSLSVALAGYFRMKIYIVSLSSLTATEENLASLFAELPTNCIVLLEDIDTAGLSKTRETKKDDDDKEGGGSDNAPTGQGQLSLSALLNILDGVAAQEGRVLIMTTNHLESLDKALIRPGRVDMIIPFQLADADMSESIFKAIYMPFDGELADGAGSKENKGKETLIDEVAVLAKEFGRRIPPNEFSPAEIQGLLLRHKRSSQTAVDAVEGWVVQMRADKKDKAEKEKKEKEEKERNDKEKKEKEEKEKKGKKNKKSKKKEKKKSKRVKEETEDENESEDQDADENQEEGQGEDGEKDGDEADETQEGGGEDEKAEKREKGKKQKQEAAAVATKAKAVKGQQGKRDSRGSSDSGYATP
ncbi:BCS1-like ATPase [Cordyceps fumosorosea ARSEF 2679]|uniref:BCS1-like ATPase n=1 Tax=Cordyceps fumosorosea (strain ARSEF 2679) TaxID=1081104 RepID=A0A167VTQ9_CORFA|nr:BCS1-like ATPase [Cordyceps fumosorosea ARSEF 2679]OAA62971.1 BCS1-like ATPase [Cordyceps fumosorosea ARSEF 2679]